jgi:hypothetical protein
MNSTLTRTIAGVSLLLIAAVLAPSSASAWGGAGRAFSGSRSLASHNFSSRSQIITQKVNQTSTVKLHTVSPNKTTTLTANDKPGKGSIANNDKKNSSPDKNKNKHNRRHRRYRGIGVDDGDDDDTADDGDDAAVDADSTAETDADASPAAAETTAEEPAPQAAALPDLELLGVSLLDGGSDEELIGPKYRVMIRNNGKVAVSDEFTVTLSAANSDQLAEDLPFNSKVIRGIEAGQTLAVDIRLPFEAMEMNTDKDGDAAAFSHLLVQVDSDNDIEETTKENNDGAVERTQVAVEKSVASR